MIVHLVLEPPFSQLVVRKCYDMEMQPGSTAADLLARAAEAEPILRMALTNLTSAFGNRFQCVYAIGGYRVAPERLLEDGDQIQVFSPILGG